MASIHVLMLALSLAPGRAGAFPAAVRYGYLNCKTCHYNVAGGGILNAYGREISRELLSTWGGASEPDFAYGKLRAPPWLALGGDLRFARSGRDAFARRSQPALTQAELEAVADLRDWIVLGAIGRRSDPLDPQGRAISPRHYVQWNATPEFSARAGRFFPDFGIWNADFSAATRRTLGLGQEQETYNLEGHWAGPKRSASLSASFGRPDSAELRHERGMTATWGMGVADAHKAGLSLSWRKNRAAKRASAGPYAMLGLASKLYLLTEWDLLRTRPASGAGPAWGLAGYQRLGYEVFRGFFFLASQDLLRSDLSDAETLADSYSLGLQWFPRPHFEFLLAWKWRRSEPGYSRFAKQGSFVLHFYP